MRFNDNIDLESRVAALERFYREHEDRHEGLVKKLVNIAGEANQAFLIAMRPNLLNGFGDYGDMISDSIKAIHVRSNYGPDVDLVDPFGPAAPNPYMQKLQPMIVLDTSFGPVTVAPYGQPGPTSWSNLLTGLGGLSVMIGALAIYGSYRLLKG